eukprot:SAG31_NODE_5966_length_2234_cov_6.011144_1_plen_107_part_00
MNPDTRSLYTRRRAELFDVLPDSGYYPDYYEIINQPISLKEIERKIKHAEKRRQNSSKACYASLDDGGLDQLVADLTLMFDNARTYNMPDSQVFNDADELEVRPSA